MYEQEIKRLIDGHYANRDNIIARCHLVTHYGYLSKSLVKSHDCLAKNCPFFEKANPDYWQHLDKIAQEKKNNRLQRKMNIKRKNDRDRLIRETLENCGNIHVTAIREMSEKFLVVSYIYDKRVDLRPEIQFLCKKLGKTIKLEAKVGSDYVIERLIREPLRE